MSTFRLFVQHYRFCGQPTKNVYRRRRVRTGISLLEVILAIGILGGSIAALSSVVLNGVAAATDAKNRLMAELLCEQQMAQLLVNNLMPTPVSDQPLPSSDPTMSYTLSVQSQPAPLNGLLFVQVSVTAQSADGFGDPLTVSLVRWMLDPTLGLEQLEAEEQAATEEAAAAESSMESSGSASGSSAGGAP